MFHSEGGRPHEKTREGDHQSFLHSQREAGERAGMSEHQVKTAVRVANVPAEVFPRMIDSDHQVLALERFEAALGELLAAHGEALRERSIVTFTRRPGLLSLLEADGDTGQRPILIVAADHREPETFGRRLETGA
jgi:hypothetical protein